MRKDIKRSLLAWPLMASASISAIGFVQTGLPILRNQASRTVASWFSPEPICETPIDMHRLASSARLHDNCGDGLEMIEDTTDRTRSLQATRRSPTTRPNTKSVGQIFLARPTSPSRHRDSANGQHQTVILAPVRNESHELAGYTDAEVNTEVEIGEVEASIDRLLTDIWENDSAWPDPLPGDDNLATNDPGTGRINVSAIAALGHRALAAMRRTDASNAASNAEPVLDAGLLELIPTTSSLPASTRVLGKLVERKAINADRDQTANSEYGNVRRVGDSPDLARDRQQSIAQRSQQDFPAGWPATPKLSEQLESLAQSAAQIGETDPTASSSIAIWIEDVSKQLSSLRSFNRLGTDEAGGAIEELIRLGIDGIDQAETLKRRSVQVEMLRAAHAINRRLAVWKPIWQNAVGGESTIRTAENSVRIDGQESLVSVRRQSQINDRLWKVTDAIEVVEAELAETGDMQGWSDFLLLDQVTKAAKARNNRKETRSIVAQRLLSRLDWHALEGEHLRWLRRDSVMNLASAVRPWTQSAVDYSELLRQVERQESNAIDLASIDIASAVQSLRFVENEHATAIAKALDVHYRNANVRIAMSQSMLNRLLPAVDPKSVPVRTTVLGTRVRGISHVQSDLNVRLTPTTDRWSIQFQTLGQIQTRSTGINGPVSVITSGKNDFVASAPIEVTHDGVDLGEVHVDVRGRTTLRGVRSKYDGWPLVGALVRSFASSKFDESKPKSNRIASAKIRSQVSTEMEKELDQKVQEASDKLSSMVLGPLGKMKLDPQVVDLETTDARLLARYRLAGDWQVAAFTPRPRAPKSSLMSVQAHQSAINNTLEQLVPRDEPMPINEVITRAANMFGQSVKIPDDVPGDVTIQFARTRPITIEIEDGMLWVTLRVVKLRRDEGMALTNFIVRAAYRPEANGLQASLVRDGHLRISGPGMSMRERLPVRAIFNKVLSVGRPLPMTLPGLVEHPAMTGLAISQFELRGGWIGIAISETNAPRIALMTSESL